jgi:alpha-galactosidase
MKNCNGWFSPFIAAAMLFCWLGGGMPCRAEDLAKTPPMGWNGWNHFGCKTSDAVIRAQAEAIVASGLKASGYVYVNIDDCWEGQRDEKGFIRPNERFPDMKALADYVHSKGLKIGIYSSPGLKTCADYEGSYGHEEQDAQAYAAWGMDYLKYDLCSYEGQGDQMAAYKKMGDALKKTGRPIVYSLCQYGMEKVWQWGPSVGGNLWRTTDDIRDNYYTMAFFGFGQNGLEKYAGPGGWNDPDMLEIGNGGMDEEESRSQMSLWCILAAPLLMGADVTKLNPTMLAILTNPEVIAVDQDPAGIQGRRIFQEGTDEIWMKPLGDYSRAVGLFNTGWGPSRITVDFADLGISETAFGGEDWGRYATVRDLWAQKDLGKFKNSFTATVPKHGVVLIKLQ